MLLDSALETLLATELDRLLAERDVNEGDDASAQSILGSLHNNNEFLTCISRELHLDTLLKLLGVRVLNEPALVLDLTVTDQ